MKDFIKDYLTFTKKDRAGIFIILILIFSGIIIPLLFDNFFANEETDINKYRSKINFTDRGNKDSGNVSFENNKHYFTPKKIYENADHLTLFEFDPNTAKVEDWIKLGVREKTALTIQKYVSKGGHFYKAEDISKIYGLHEKDVKRLIPYIRIVKKSFDLPKKINQPFTHINKYPESYKPRKDGNHININTADTSEFMTLPGIGIGFAKRIINFRNKLGGFYSVDQIKETYGLPDSTFLLIKDRILIGAGNLEKKNINTCSVEELGSHPYIRYRLASAIVSYRKQHGLFNDLNDLKKIMIIDEGLFIRIKEYLKLE